MSTRTEPWPAGTPCWADLAVPDVGTARDFYGTVMGWDFDDSGEEYGNFQTCRVKGQAAAGFGTVMSPEQPSVWTLYLASSSLDTTAQAVADADVAVQAATERGGAGPGGVRPVRPDVYWAADE